MKFAIIAAGNGSRLSQEGIIHPKPLVPINGVPAIERLITIFNRFNAESINIVINDKQPETFELLERLKKEYPLNIIVKNTPSSMHSMYELRNYLKGGKFCLTTVDTIFKENEFATYLNAFENSVADGFMAVTEYIDDEKPLYIDTNEELDITGFYDKMEKNFRYVSGGIYGLNQNALTTLEYCISQNMSRMRNFQRQMITDGLRLKAFPFGKIIDIDHASDIEKAEKLIQEK